MFSFSACGDGVELGKGEVPRLINGISQPGKWSARNKLSAAYLWVFWLPFFLIGSQGYTEQTVHPRMAMQALKCALPQWWVERAYLPEWLTVAGPWGRVFRGFLRGIPAEWSFCTQACMLSHFSCVWLFVTLWTVAHQAPLSMEFSRQEYWSGLLCPPPGDHPDPGIKPLSQASPALAGGFFTLAHHLGSPPKTNHISAF